MIIHIGIDDTDSPNGMCTTYLGAILYRELSRLAEPLDLPRLIRLNPNIPPYKTRGNGAVAMTFEADEDVIPPEIKDTVLFYVSQLADFEHENTNPGVVFLEGGEVPNELRKFSLRALREHVTIGGEAEEVARKVGGAEYFKFKLGRGGVIGVPRGNWLPPGEVYL